MITERDMTHDIRHDGIIDSIEGRHIRVRILQTSACGACQIAAHCRASEMKEKVVDVDSDPKGLSIGQAVVVSTTDSVARRALIAGFGLPLVILLAVLVATLLISHDEEVAGMAALCSLVPYYVVLWMARERISRHVAFGIEAKGSVE